MNTTDRGVDPGSGEIHVIGRPPSRWREFRTRLSDWIHPDARFFKRNFPIDPVAREIAELVFLNIDRMSATDRAEILADMRRRLGIEALFWGGNPNASTGSAGS